MSGELPSKVGEDGKVHIPVHQLKSPLFRNIVVDGVYGGITPKGTIHVAVFSERTPIPTQIGLILDQGGSFIDEDASMRVQRDGFVRELEAGLVLTTETAESVAQWLLKKVQEAKELEE